MNLVLCTSVEDYISIIPSCAESWAHGNPPAERLVPLFDPLGLFPDVERIQTILPETKHIVPSNASIDKLNESDLMHWLSDTANSTASSPDCWVVPYADNHWIMVAALYAVTRGARMVMGKGLIQILESASRHPGLEQ